MAKLSLLCTGLLSLSAVCGAVDPRIVGGHEVNPPFSLPWMAAIVHANSPSSYDGQHCGATIIGPRHALTAAHCADPSKNLPNMRDALAVEAGRHDLSQPADQENPPHTIRNLVVEIHRPHPRQLKHDVAVLVLEREYPPETYSSVVLNQNESHVHQTGLEITAVGWGASDAHGKEYPKRLQTLDLQVIDHAKCERWYKGSQGLAEFEFCAGYAGKDTCFGDSGGPTFRIVDGSYLLLGIESWGGEKCALANRPGVRASIAHHYDFIQNVILGNTPAPTSKPPTSPTHPPSGCHATVSNHGWIRNCPKRCNKNGGRRCHWQCANKCSADCLCNQGGRLLSADALV